jgi:hypothetical protein
MCTLVFTVTLTQCKKLVEIPAPETEIVRSEIFEDSGTALSALSGVYNKLVNSAAFGGNLSITMGVYADELTAYQSAPTLLPYYSNQLVATDPAVSGLWGGCYNMIYAVNAVIEGLGASSGIVQGVKDQLTGEALFIRAYVHFYLVNQFGDIPYITTTTYLVNSKKGRTHFTEVYKGIISDLSQAKALLLDNYPTGERVRVNKGAAIALLARVYLYNHEWANAEAESSAIIVKTSQYELLIDLNTVFLKNNKEAIWQLIPPYGATNEGQAFILVSQPTRIALKTGFAESVFEPNDLRRQSWVGSVTVGFSTWYYPFKYKVKSSSATPTEYSMQLRLAEQYLIRAEARAKQNKLTGDNSAVADIDSIRHRAGLPGTWATTKDQVLLAIEQERRAELFSEWGHRFFDLKRWNRLDAVLGSLKPGWNTTDALLPIPQSEILANGHLTQNKGY